MARTSRKLPQLAWSEADGARRARGWLERFLAPLAIEPAGRVDGRINVFKLAGTMGAGLLAESESQVEGRPGVWQNRSNLWVRRHSGPLGGVRIEVLMHGWDAWADAAITGDRHWLDVPRRQMYAERDRRTAALGAELDRFEIWELQPGTVPALDVGLGSPQVGQLAARYQPSLLEPSADSPGIGEPSWTDFQSRLGRALELMAPETFLILTAAPERDGRTFYIQFAHATSMFRAEAIGARHLPPDEALDAAQLDELDSLGWRSPDSDEEKGSNFHRDWELPVPFADVAALAVRTLRDVHGVIVPADLQYDYRSFEGTDVDPDLGLGLQPRPTSHQHHPAVATDPDELRALVEGALRGWMGVAEVEKDDDGDYPVRVGSAMLYVRIIPGPPPFLAIFSPILRDIAASPALLEAINELNARIRFGRVFWAERTVIVATELAAVDVTANQVALACLELGSLADDLDDSLRGRFGGRTMFADEPGRLN